MRTLSAGQTTANALTGKRIYRFLKIEWGGGDGDKYYSFQSVTIDSGLDTEPILESFPTISRTMDVGFDFGLGIDSIGFSLRNSPQDSPRLETLIQSRGTIQGIVVRPYIVFEPTSGSIVEADWIALGIFEIQDYSIDTTRIDFNAVDWIKRAANKNVGRFVTVEDFPLASTKSLGAFMPWVFGVKDNCPLKLVGGGQFSFLATSLEVSDTTAFLESVTGFPTSGTIFIDNEVITYTGKNTSNNSLTGLTRAADGTQEEAHSTGARVRLKPPGGYVFLVADHHCYFLQNVEVNGVRYQGSDFVFSNTTLGGKKIAYCTITDLPILSIQSTSEIQSDLQDDLTSWAQSTGNNAADWASAVDSGDDKHTTFSLLTPGKTLKVTPTINLSARQTVLKRAKLYVDYTIKGVVNVSTGDIIWPVGSQIPKIDISSPYFPTRTVDMAIPDDREVKAQVPEVTPDFYMDDTKQFFAPLDSDDEAYYAEFGARYVSGYDPNVPIGGSPPQSVIGWPTMVGYSAADNHVIGSMPSVIPTLPPSSANSAASSNLRLRVEKLDAINPTARIIQIEVEVDISREVETFGTDCDVNVNIMGLVQSATIPQGGGKTFKRTLIVNEFPSATELKEINIFGQGQIGVTEPDIVAYAIYFNVDAVRVRLKSNEVLVGAKLYGADNAIDAYVEPIPEQTVPSPSLRLTQEIDLTSEIFPVGWPVFAGSQITVGVRYPNSGLTNEVLIQNIRFGVRELLTTISNVLVTDETAEARATITGLSNPYSIGYIQDPLDMIKFLIDTEANNDGYDNFLNIGVSTYLDETSVINSQLDTGYFMTVARYIDRQFKPIDLLMSVARDAGIRLLWTGLLFKGIPRLRALPGESLGTLSRAEMVRSPITKKTMRPNTGMNRLLLNYNENALDEGKFSSQTIFESITSQNESWGIIEQLIEARNISNSAVANVLGNRIINDYSARRDIVSVKGFYDWIKYEIGDPIIIDDPDSELTTRIGRVVNQSLDDSHISINAIISDTRVRFWEYDATTYIDVFAGILRMIIVINNVTVAILDSSGNLRLLGNFYSEVFTPETTQSASDSADGSIEFYSPGGGDLDFIGFAIKDSDSANFRRVARLESDGSLYMYSVESTAGFPISEATSDYVAWDDGDSTLEFSLDLLNIYMEMVREVVSGDTNAVLKLNRLLTGVL